MRNVIAGTAGHIDHGKTALVKALTGTDTDRWEEEKRRGISIDIGFAHLALGDDVRIGFVDVPGHERFVRNMLAGAGGIDLVLLIIAADESVKPQTREHFDICRLLHIPRGMVVITKLDLAEAATLSRVRHDAVQLTAGTFLEGAPVVFVSSKTGEGLDELRVELRKLALDVPQRDATRHFRLPIDRSFSMKGFGTVVTGTLVAGSVAEEEEVEVHPAGLRLRVRGIQVHGKGTPRALAGQRTAVNLAGVEATDIRRGMVLTAPGLFRPTRRVDCRFDLLASARPLKHGVKVHFHSGTAEAQASVRLLDRTGAVEPGQAAFARLLLAEPLLLLPGDRFILRMFSPVVTIAGGTVLDIAAPLRLPRAAALDRLKTLAGEGLPPKLALLAGESAGGVSLSDLVARTGLLPDEIVAAAELAGLVAVSAPKPWLFARAWLENTARLLVNAAGAFHQSNPLQPGIPREQLRGRFLAEAPSFAMEAVLKQAPELVAEGEVVRLRSHRVSFSGEEEAALATMERLFEDAGLRVPSLKEVLAKSGVEEARARTLLQILLRKGRLVRVSPELVYHPAAIAQLKKVLATRKGQKFSVPEFKEWTGITRKYAIPLLEFLDRARVTRREGDLRVVL